MKIISIIIILAVGGCKSAAHSPMAAAPATQPTTQRAESPSEREQRTRQAIDRGVQYLIKSQEADGSWGTGRVTRGFEVYSMVPGSLDAFRVGTTALCVMSLREFGEKETHDLGLELLIRSRERTR